MKGNLRPLIHQVQNRLVVWFVLAIVLQIIGEWQPLPFVRIIAWLAVGYCLCLLILLLILLMMNRK